MINKRNWITALTALVLAGLACNLPGGEPQEQTATETSSAIASDTPIPSNTPSPVAACVPTLTASTLANIRSGPSQDYAVIGNLPQGASANVAGRNAENTWWYIEFAGGENGYGWISTTVAVANCIPNTLAIIAPPPLPSTSTPEPTIAGVTPSATPTFIIFIPPGGFQLFNTATPTPTLLFKLPLFPLPNP